MLHLNRHVTERDLQRYQARALDRITALVAARRRWASRSQPTAVDALKTAIDLIRLQQAGGLTALRRTPVRRRRSANFLHAEAPSALLGQIDAGLQQARGRTIGALRPLTRLRLLHFPTALHWNP